MAKITISMVVGKLEETWMYDTLKEEYHNSHSIHDIGLIGPTDEKPPAGIKKAFSVLLEEGNYYD